MIKQLLYILSLLLLVVTTVTSSGCSSFCDGSVGEPTFSLTISESHTISKIYALMDDGLGDQIGSDNPIYTELPVNMNAESVIYVFEQQGLVDTLEILYNIKTDVESKVCGLRVRADNIELGERTTFTDVVIYGSNKNTQITIK